MNTVLQMTKITIIVALIAVFYSCGGNGKTAKEESNAVDSTLENTLGQNDSIETYYLIPSPEELFRFIKDGKLKFSKSILNPTTNIDNYMDTRSKELNFGIYSADLAYVASFNKYQESIDYLGVVRNLSDEVGISSVFDKNLIGRIDNIIDDQDSLLKVTNDTYLSIVGYLETVDRKKSLAQIVTGGWIESIYVVSNLVEGYDANSKVISLLASQKIVVENLMLYLDAMKDDTKIAKTIDGLKPLAELYKSLKEKSGTKPQAENTKKSGDKIIVGGDKEVVMTAEQFEQLKTEVTKLRNKITSN